MTLSQCRLGEIVRESHVLSAHRIGHITGLTANPAGEVIPFVRWACVEKDEGIHPGNLMTMARWEWEQEQEKLGDGPFD